MIDTDKYEGHTPAPWWVSDCGLGYIDAQNWIGSEGAGDGWVQTVAKVKQEDGEQDLAYSNVDTWSANAQLIADAPLLLAEVKQLREELDGREAYIKRLNEQLVRATKWAGKQVCWNDSAMMDFDDYVWGEEE
ncbi:MAG: hypothetical protein CMF74_12640 [Maricaulis sp.]|nr:hypothetical protein [Maricaulis sp.]|tara:strand:- start:138 stop:536 length:399 start_codon:yes stop_codon:yes gene_type:complete